MGQSGDDLETPTTVDHTRELREKVDREMRRFLDSVTEVDIATVYRTIIGLIGAHVVPHIAEVIGARLRSGDIEIETRNQRPNAPTVAFIRRHPAGLYR